MQRNPAIVLNPSAGNGRARRLWRRNLEPLAHEVLPDVEIFESTASDEATALTREAIRRGHRTIVALGGDGTVNEVANGFFDENGERICDDAVLAVVPLGTGGDFARAAGVPRDPVAAMRRLGHAGTRWIDVGRVRYTTESGATATRFFVNDGDFGLSGHLAHRINATGKPFGAKVSYFLAALVGVLTWRNRLVRLVVDDGPCREERLKVAIAANGPYIAGGMSVCPDARLDSGRLELVVFGDLGIGSALRLLTQVYRGRRLEHPRVGYEPCRKLRVEADSPIRMTVDGEQPGWLPATFEILPSTILLHAPDAAPC